MADVKYINEKEVSEITNISIDTLQKDRHLKKGFPYTKIGRSVKYSLQDIIDYMEKNKVYTTSK